MSTNYRDIFEIGVGLLIAFKNWADLPRARRAEAMPPTATACAGA